MNYDYVPFIAGSIAGATGAIAGHPFDTIKTNLQTNQPSSLRNLYRGLPNAATAAVISFSFMFGVRKNLDSQIENPYLKGAIAGIGNAILINTNEYNKIQKQNTVSPQIKWFTTRGLGVTTGREIIGLSVYFGFYDNLRNQSISPFIAGSLTGIGCWLFSYPLDIIKTIVQTDLKTTYRQELRKMSFQANGLSYCLLRASIANAIIFPVFETTTAFLRNHTL